jgi:RNA polymerase sigma-70 factor, ECF subfamily
MGHAVKCNPLERSEEFAEMLQRHHGDIFSYIYSLVLNQADAEDLYQETAIILWKKFAEFEPNSSFRHWAIRVAHLSVMNFVRKHRSNRLVFSEDAINIIAAAHERGDSDLSSSQRDALRACMKQLTSNDRRLVESRYAQRRTVPEIAVNEKRSVDAIYKTLSRIRSALFQCIQRRLSMEGRP